MLKYTFLLLYIYCGLKVNAQDIIKKKDGSSLNVLIITITDKDIDYKISGETGNVQFSISKSDVLYIRYEDGTIEHFNFIASQDKREEITPTEPDIIYLKSGKPINAIVDSISDELFFYRNFNNLSGPVNILPGELIESIIYNKNSKFNPRNRQVIQVKKNTEVQPSAIIPSSIKSVMPKNRFYLTGSYGKSYAIGNEYFGTNYYIESFNGKKKVNEEIVYGSLGKGNNWEVGFGFLFSEKIGIQLTYGNFTGNQLLVTSYVLVIDTIGKKYITDETRTSTKISANYSNLNLCMLVKHKWLYTKIGITAATIKVNIDSTYSHIVNTPSLYKNRLSGSQLTSSIQYGFNAGLGVQLPLGNHLGVFCETSASIISFHPEHQKYDQVIENGKFSPNPPEITFKSESNTDNPNQLLQKPFSLNSWGWNAGIRILF